MATEDIIKILYIEDVQYEMELAIYELKKEQIRFTCERVETKSEVISHLRDFQPDIILTDYYLPEMDGSEVLRISKELAPHTPVIIVTGALNEETAVECMKAGASDYLLKDKLKRLPFAVTDALELKKVQLSNLNTQHALAKSEQRFKEISELAQEFIWELDSFGKFTYANRVSHRLLGFYPEELIGKRFFYDYFVPEFKDRIFESAREIINSKSNFLNFQCPLVHKDGHEIMVEITGLTIRGEDNSAMGFRGLARDITERKKKEDDLKGNNARLEITIRERTHEVEQLSKLNTEIINSLELAVITTALDGTIKSFNPEAERMLGYSSDEVIEKFSMALAEQVNPEVITIQDQIVLLEGTSSHPAYKRLIESNASSFFGELNYLTRNGDLIPVQLYVNRLEDENGQTTGYVGLAFDITDRRKATELLEKSEAENRAIISTVPDLLFRIDRNGTFLGSYNDSSNPLYMPKEQFMGKKVPDVLPSTQADKIMAVIEEAFETNEVISIEYDLPIANESRYYESRIIALDNHEVLAIIRDITDRKKTEISLRWNESFLRLMTSSSPMAFFVVDNRTDDILYHNHRFCEIWEITHLEKQMAGRNLKNADVLQACLPMLKNIHVFLESNLALQSEQNRETIEDSIEFIDGRIIRRYTTQIRGEKDEYHGRFFIYEDITERKNAEVQLQLRESYLSAVIKNHPGMFWLKDTEGRFVFINDLNHSFIRNANLDDPTVLIGKTDFDLVSKTLAQQYKTEDDEVMLTKQPKSVEEKLVLENRETWFEKSKYPVFDAEGNVIGISGYSIDITHRKEIEDALRKSEERWQFALEGSGDGVWDWNVVTGKVFYSPQWKVMFGYSDEEIGNDISEWAERVHREDIDQSWKDLNAYFRGENPFYINEHRVLCKDGTYKWTLGRGKSVEWTMDNQPLRVIGTVTDISRSKMLEASLMAAIEKEKELNEMKTRFVATASHEFRTPLASILITSDTLLEYWKRMGKQQIDERLHKIKEQTLHLNSIVDNVLQISRVQEGKLGFDPEEVELVALCQESIDSFSSDPKAYARIQFISELPEIRVAVDKALVLQSISNLISNAIKYSSPDSLIKIHVARLEEYLEISINDKGIGIPEEEQKHLFEPFFRASNTKLIQGNGLGLNIVRESIRQHGGEVTFESSPAEGTTFFIHLPLKLIITW